MPIAFRCESCGRSYAAPRRLAGRAFRCRGCGHVQPIIDEAPAAPARALTLEPGPPPPPRAGPPSREQAASSPKPRPIRSAIFEESRLQGIACALLILSAADLFMTYALLRTSPAFFESNPVANWFFARWNMAGMTLFKFSVIGGVIALAEIIERRRPGWGRLVLLIGCCGAAYAVCKGLRLYAGHGAA